MVWRSLATQVSSSSVALQLELGFGHYISCGSGPLVITWKDLACSDNVLCLEVGSLPIHTAAFMQLFTWELYMNLIILRVLTQLHMHTKDNRYYTLQYRKV